MYTFPHTLELKDQLYRIVQEMALFIITSPSCSHPFILLLFAAVWVVKCSGEGGYKRKSFLAGLCTSQYVRLRSEGSRYFKEGHIMMKNKKQMIAAALAAAMFGAMSVSAAPPLIEQGQREFSTITYIHSGQLEGSGADQKWSDKGSVAIGGDAGVTGNQTIHGTQWVKKNQEVDGNAVIKGNQTVEGSLTVGGIDVKAYTTANAQSIKILVDAVHNTETAIQEANDRVDKANAGINTNKDNIAQNKKDIASNTERINKLEPVVSTHQKAILNNSNAIISNAKNIEALAGTAFAGIDKANAEIHTNAGNIAQNKLDIAANKEAIGKETVARTEADAALQKNIDTVNQTVTAQGQQLGALSSRVNKLDGEIDSVGALSAALAGLHPLDYEGGSKFQISAAVGTYDGTQAGALGAFYHANKDVLVSLAGSTSFGGDNKTAANLGVTFRVGQSGEVEKADTATIEKLEAEIEALKAEVAALKK